MNLEIVRDEVAPSEYARIISAAIHMGRTKFDLAEALVLDIPPKRAGDGASVKAQLEQVAQEIVDNGGDEIAWNTLSNYRLTALWSQSAAPGAADFAWRKGTSYSAHQAAALGSMDYEEFAKLPRTKREVAAMLGQTVDDSVKQTVDDMTDTDKADLITALVNNDPDALMDAWLDKQRQDIIDDAGGSVTTSPPPPMPPTPSTSTDNIERIAYMKGIVAGAVSFTGTMLGRWSTALTKVHGVMDDDDRNVFAGNLDDIAELYTGAANQLRDNTWTQK